MYFELLPLIINSLFSAGISVKLEEGFEIARVT